MTTTQHKIDTGEHKGMANFTINNDKYDKIFSQAAAVYDVDCTLLKAVMLAESQGHPWAKSHVGAVGLMQLMPSTAYSMGYRGNLFNPETNIMAGAAYLRHLTTTGCYEKIENNVCDMRTDINYLLAAYNGGSKANKPAYLSSCPDITAWQCPLFYGYAETRNYVNKVKANYDKLWQNNWQCL